MPCTRTQQSFKGVGAGIGEADEIAKCVTEKSMGYDLHIIRAKHWLDASLNPITKSAD